MSDPRDGVPFTGFSPTLGPVANANSTSGTVQLDSSAQGYARGVRLLRQRSSLASRRLVEATLDAAQEVASRVVTPQVLAKSARNAPYDLGGLIEIIRTPFINDTACVEAAFAAAALVEGGVRVEVNGKPFELTRNITVTLGANRGIHLVGCGARSGFVSYNGSGITVILADSTASFSADNLAFLHGGSVTSGRGLAVIATVLQTATTCSFNRLTFSGVLGRESAWQTALYLEGLSAPVINEMHLYAPDGTATNGATSVAVQLNGSSTQYITDVKINNCLIQGGGLGVGILGKMQGIYIANTSIIGNTDGIRGVETDGSNAQEFVCITNSHFNCSRYCVALPWCNENFISNTLFLHFSPDAAIQWRAIWLANSSFNVIANNMCIGNSVANALEESFLLATGGTILHKVSDNVCLNLSTVAIDMQATGNSSITANVVHNSGEPGIKYNSYNNMLYANNLVNARIATSFATQSSANISAAGTTQATATPITTNYAYVTALPANAGVVLPATSSLPSSVITTVIVASQAVGSTNIYPATGDAIVGSAANAPRVLTAPCEMTFRYIGTGTMWIVYTARP